MKNIEKVKRILDAGNWKEVTVTIDGKEYTAVMK